MRRAALILVAVAAIAAIATWEGGPLGAALEGPPPVAVSAIPKGDDDVVPGENARRVARPPRATLERYKLRRGEWRLVWNHRARDYLSAADFVGRFVFPGTRWWLIACSSSEGGHGPWVWNSPAPGRSYPLSRYPTRPAGSSGAGGWLQFKSGTFWGYADAAWDAALENGYRVPRAHKRWTDPVGQAIVGAYMLTLNQRHQWEGARC